MSEPQQQVEPALRLTVTVDDSNPLDRHHFELEWLQTPLAAGEYLYYAAPPAVQAEPVEAGPWIANASEDGKKAWVDSLDFTHDVRLNISGDFEDDKQKFAYAEALARKLNAAPPAVQAEPVACLVGIKGSAFDLPTTKRAYTYAEQPGNVIASRLGSACDAAALQSAGDSIDRGLGLLQELQKVGFGVFDLGAEYAAPPADDEAVRLLREARERAGLELRIAIEAYLARMTK